MAFLDSALIGVQKKLLVTSYFVQKKLKFFNCLLLQFIEGALCTMHTRCHSAATCCAWLTLVPVRTQDNELCDNNGWEHTLPQAQLAQVQRRLTMMTRFLQMWLTIALEGHEVNDETAVHYCAPIHWLEFRICNV